MSESMLTNWGYTINASSLEPLISAADFGTITADKYDGDGRIISEINAASSAIRDYCGWHIYPSKPCVMSATFFDRRISRTGSALLIQLPARFVSAITSVKINDVDYTTYVFDTNGLLKVYCVDVWLPEWAPVVVEYTAGLSDQMANGMKEVVANCVVHGLTSTGGVQSEAAGGVSVTYSSSWVNSGKATSLADDNKEILNPYRLQGVF